MTDTDILAALSPSQVLGLTIYGESRGEPVEGRIAVGCVVRNRLTLGRYGRDYKAVCLRKFQFSCWNEADPNRGVLIDAARLILRNDVIGPDLRECLWIADGVVDQVVKDRSRGADHYLTHGLWRSAKCPSWAKDREPAAIIGTHVFLRLEGVH